MARDVRRSGARHGDDEAVRITTASSSRREDISARERRYVLSMGIRTVCFIAAVLVWHVSGWASGVLIVAALVLPYVAVVMANAASTKEAGFALPDGGREPRELGDGPARRDDDDTPGAGGPRP